MRVLVCGGRDYGYVSVVERALDYLHATRTITVLIHGDAPGADTLAKQWAQAHNIPVWPFPAKWHSYLGSRAGFRRNQQMLDIAKPDALLHFPGGRGTRDMVARAKRAGIETIWYFTLPL